MAPNKTKTANRKGGAGSAPSAFSQASLTQLTAQIDRDLESRNAKNLNGGKRKRDADAGDNDDEDDQATASKTQKTQKTEKTQPSRKGKKTNGTTNGDKKTVMLDEIKALGGDEDDFDLVDGIDSDAEEGSGGQGGKSAADDALSLDAAFKSELAKFAAGLGFDEVREEDEDEEEMAEEQAAQEEEQDEEDEEEEEEEEEEDVEDEEEEEEQEDEEEEEEVVEAPKPEAPKPAVSTDPFLPKNPKFSQLIVEPRADWHMADPGALPAPTSDDIYRLSQTINNLKAYAETLMEADSTAYRNITSASSSHRFMSTIMTSGTMSDKVSALTLEIQEAPIHNAKAFENLMALAGKRSRGAAIAALGALVDLLGNGVVLPSDRRLRSFHAQPALLGALQAAGPATALTWKQHLPLPGGITKAHLVLWKYEDWLKDAFFQMLQQLEVWCNDEIEYSRSRSLDFVFGLLKSKPEQEANLLRLLVNKLGDRERKIASRASYLLLQLLNTHPGMKAIVVQTIEQEILLRPGQSLRAKYYGINTLNQTILSNKEPAIADSLVRVYFELFLTLLKSGALGGMDISNAEKLGEDDKAKGNAPNGKDAKKKWKRSYHDKAKDGKKGGAAADKNEGIEKDVSEKLVSALLTGVNRAIPFANTDNTTLEKHLDTLFRITHSSNFNTSIQALMLVQQVAGSKQLSVDRFYRTLYESLLDPRLVTSSKQGMYLNLLFRALKNDVDVRRVKAFVKRMLQIATLHQPPFICGILFLVVELETTFPDLKALLNEPEFDDDDEEEYYRDVPEDGEDAEKQAAEEAAAEEAKNKEKQRAVYDGRKRDPSYSNAQNSCLWEIVPYFQHFHPSVTAFATNLLVRQKSLPKPDMANHTLMHFLDKFVYRNAKSADATKQRGASIMQPVSAATLSTTGAAQVAAPGKGGDSGKSQTVAINSAAFWGQKVENVAAEDIFFHTYFSQVGKQSQTSRAAKRAAKQEKAAAAAAFANDEEGGDGDVTDPEEEEIWQALKGSRPDIEGEDEGDNGDMDMDDDDDDDLEELKDLLNMSDSDDDDLDDDDLDDEDVEGGADAMDVDGDSDGGVQFGDFAEFSDEEEGGVSAKDKDSDGLVSLASNNGRKAGRERRKQLKAMPTFASADDYAEMLANEADEDYQ
ncbi:RNA-binding ribosome biosynthesis protein mak21 [Sporothrix bragantina]|uniref:RNA-binding ribosome biosynthesis protein mak21 n=1 Tax=Sporothrix bragantina TaxID=671064 RepID=A0ABP0BU86_9PEZI